MKNNLSNDFEVEVSLISKSQTNKPSQNQTQNQSQIKNIKFTHTIWFLAVVNMSMMIFAGTGKSLIIEINQQSGQPQLGHFTFFSNYLGSILGIPLVIHSLRSFTLNKIIWISSMSQTIISFGTILSSFCQLRDIKICEYNYQLFIHLVISFIGGFLASFFFNAIPAYIKFISSYEEQGKNFGINYSLFNASGIIGNTLAYFTIKYFSHFTFLVILAIAGLSIQLLFLLLKQQKLLKNQDSICQIYVKQTKQLCLQSRDPYFRQQYPYQMTQGTSSAMIYIFLPSLLQRQLNLINTSNIRVNELTFFMFQCIGAGELLGGMLFGKASDKFGKHLVSQIQLFLAISCLSYTLIIEVIGQPIYMIYTVAFFLGMNDSATQTLNQTIIQIHEKINRYQLLIGNFFVCITYAVCSQILNYLSMKTSLIIFLCLYTIAFVFIGVNKRSFKDQTNLILPILEDQEK